MRIAFLGLGHMGLPMATNLARSGAELVVWSRRPEPVAAVVEAGATAAGSPHEAVLAAEVVIVMLAHGEAIDEVLGRGTARFGDLEGRTLVHMGTTSQEYSLGLAQDVASVGGRYVEAPVSGSRVPAEQGALVAMLAGDADATALVAELIAPMCKQSVHVGEVPQALGMKLAVNLFLITQVVGVVESFHFASERGLPLELFQQVLDAGPMASAVSTLKLAKLVSGDFTAQAGLADVHYNCRLIDEAARASGTAAPLLAVCRDLFARAEELGRGADDMVAVVEAIRPA